jgi:hypothetical protein
MILTLEQRQALDSFVEVAWGNGAWKDYPQSRQASIAWALAGTDEAYAKAIQRYLKRAWAAKQMLEGE